MTTIIAFCTATSLFFLSVIRFVLIFIDIIRSVSLNEGEINQLKIEKV